MKVLFLDIDGVLNTSDFLEANWKGRKIEDYSIYIMEEKVELLNKVFDSIEGLKLCIHSSWGKFIEVVKIKSALESKGFKYWDNYIGLTPKRFSSEKCNEISWFLDSNRNITKWLYVDDDEFLHLRYIKNHYDMVGCRCLTDSKVGITESDVEYIIKFYKGKY